jgi:hypothetical protein
MTFKKNESGSGKAIYVILKDEPNKIKGNNSKQNENPCFGLHFFTFLKRKKNMQ